MTSKAQTYRGIASDWSPLAIDITPAEIGGKYRGQNWHYRYLRHVPELRSRPARTYRGVTYRPVATVQPVLPTATAPALPPAVLLPDESRCPLATAQEAFRQSLRQRLEHRLAVARAAGNERLIGQLEREFRELTLH